MGLRAFLAGFVAAGVFLMAISVAKADSEWEAPQPTPNESPTPLQQDQSSKNFSKTGKFLPGEEVVTSTGKKMRVWSTEGPVPVMQPTTPPQGYGPPGYGPNNGVPFDVNVIVDERAPVRRKSPQGPTGGSDR